MIGLKWFKTPRGRFKNPRSRKTVDTKMVTACNGGYLLITTRNLSLEVPLGSTCTSTKKTTTLSPSSPAEAMLARKKKSRFTEPSANISNNEIKTRRLNIEKKYDKKILKYSSYTLWVCVIGLEVKAIFLPET